MAGALDQLVADMEEITDSTEGILPPVELLHACDVVARGSGFDRAVIGATERGMEIPAYSRGDGPAVLLYGFPDPGEAVGGTGILALMRALSKDAAPARLSGLRWSFVPCLNFDDQPCGGRELRKIHRSTRTREVDWCLDDPRSETRALLRLAGAIRPAFTFALHDEYHGGEALDTYAAVSRPLPPAVCDSIRTFWGAFGLSPAATPRHETMGPAFIEMGSHASDFERSTFSVLARYGTVFCCEVSDVPSVRPADLVAAQLGSGILAMEEALRAADGSAR